MSTFSKDNYQSILNILIYIVQITAEVFATAQSWYLQHADTIKESLVKFGELSVWFSAVQKMIDAQIVFTGDLSLELAKEICLCDNVIVTVERFYTENDECQINDVIERCREAKQMFNFTELFSQIISSYQVGHYHLACLGMFSIVDGVLSNVSEDPKTNYKKRLEIIENKIISKYELTDLEKKLLCIYLSMNDFEASIFMHSDFAQVEPNKLNRHWMVHGRTQREYAKIDFVKIILWLDAIIFLDDKLTDPEDTNNA